MSYKLSICNLSKAFNNIKAVDNISFNLNNGIVALLGPNGAGKTTLMNMIAGHLAPDGGEILVEDCNISQQSLACKKNIGFLPEGSPLYSDMTVKAFIKYIGALKNATNEQISKAIEIAQISEVLNQKNETLSKGFQRRVGFAQSILTDPPILLLDEPTDGLDPNQKEHIQKTIQKMGKTKTILISSHLLDEVEAIADRIIIMNKGQIKADGTLMQILHQTKSINLAEAFKKLTNNQ